MTDVTPEVVEPVPQEAAPIEPPPVTESAPPAAEPPVAPEVSVEPVSQLGAFYLELVERGQIPPHPDGIPACAR
jgi:hypothetical protein